MLGSKSYSLSQVEHVSTAYFSFGGFLHTFFSAGQDKSVTDYLPN